MSLVDTIINPTTGRQIKVGSTIYKKLVKEGTIKSRPLVMKDNKCYCQLEAGDVPEPVQEKVKLKQDEKMTKLRALKIEKDKAKMELKNKELVMEDNKYKKKYKALKEELEKADEAK